MSHFAPTMLSNVKTERDAAYVDAFRGTMRRSLLIAPKQDLPPRFAQHDQHVRALPRCARRSLQRQWTCTPGGVALLLALMPGAAFAATMNVAANITPDVNADGKCSLIEAIFNANTNSTLHGDCPAGSGADTIILPVSSKQVLTNSMGPLPDTFYYAQGVPEVRSTIVIEGRGSTIERSDGSPIDLMIAVETNGDLTLNETIISGKPAAAVSRNNDVLPILNRGNLSIGKGSVLRGYSLYGGGLRNEGTATLRNSTVAQNVAGYNGGGIYNATNATLTVNDSVVSDNRAIYGSGGGSNAGGGIYNRGVLIVNRSSIVRNTASPYGVGGGIDNSGIATLRNSIVAENSASTSSGGISNIGTLTVENTSISSNSAQFAGGIGNGTAATANIVRSTIADNVATGYVTYNDQDPALGGGILTRGTMALVNSTVSGNRAIGYGGGIWAESGTLTLTHATVTSNRADLPNYWHDYNLTAIGGGISAGADAVVYIEQSLVSGNQSQGKDPEIGIFPRTTPTFVANSFNIFGVSGTSGVQGFTPGPTDIIPIVAIRGIVMPRSNNGGATPTHALAVNSPALNAAPVDAACAALDQRGNPRPQGGKCDVGSFEGSAVLCNGLVTTQVGTINADTLTGTAGRDVIAGLNGNDTLRGLNNNDVICAGTGVDKVYGGNGNDALFGDAGNDMLNGGAGTDVCNGGTNTDAATQCETVVGVP